LPIIQGAFESEIAIARGEVAVTASGDVANAGKSHSALDAFAPWQSIELK